MVTSRTFQSKVHKLHRPGQILTLLMSSYTKKLLEDASTLGLEVPAPESTVSLLKVGRTVNWVVALLSYFSFIDALAFNFTYTTFLNDGPCG
jgi:hypothetical protein